MLDESISLSEFKDESEEERSRLIDICVDYFGVSIGQRKLTESEADEALTITSRHAVQTKDLTQVERVKMLMLPIITDEPSQRRLHYQFEYLLFDYLSEETDIIDGPYIPMLRYEISMQRELWEDEKYDTGVLRLSTFLETFFKMKMGKWKNSNGKYLTWDICVNSAYRGEDLITDSEYLKLRKLPEERNPFAHDWRHWAIRHPSQTEEIEQAFSAGLETICALYGRELKRVYEDYTGNHISESYSTQWNERDKCRPEAGELQVRVEKTCKACGSSFHPRFEGYKRCPECDEPHDWLEKIGSKFE